MADGNLLLRSIGGAIEPLLSKPWLALGLMLLAGTAAEAQNLYVTDEVLINLRTGPSTQNTIIQNLSTGDAVTVLEENREDGYARVRTPTGAEGWVLRRYLQEMPAARNMLTSSQQALAQARERIAELEDTIESLSEQLGTVTQRMEEAESAATTLNAELVDVRSASANALTIRDQFESQRRTNFDLEQRVEALTMENAELTGRANREWFLLGAGVLFAGIVLGLIVPSLRRKRRVNW